MNSNIMHLDGKGVVLYYSVPCDIWERGEGEGRKEGEGGRERETERENYMVQV